MSKTKIIGLAFIVTACTAGWYYFPDLLYLWPALAVVLSLMLLFLKGIMYARGTWLPDKRLILWRQLPKHFLETGSKKKKKKLIVHKPNFLTLLLERKLLYHRAFLPVAEELDRFFGATKGKSKKELEESMRSFGMNIDAYERIASWNITRLVWRSDKDRHVLTIHITSSDQPDDQNQHEIEIGITRAMRKNFVPNGVTYKLDGKEVYSASIGSDGWAFHFVKCISRIEEYVTFQKTVNLDKSQELDLVIGRLLPECMRNRYCVIRTESEIVSVEYNSLDYRPLLSLECINTEDNLERGFRVFAYPLLIHGQRIGIFVKTVDMNADSKPVKGDNAKLVAYVNDFGRFNWTSEKLAPKIHYIVSAQGILNGIEYESKHVIPQIESYLEREIAGVEGVELKKIFINYKDRQSRFNVVVDMSELVYYFINAQHYGKTPQEYQEKITHIFDRIEEALLIPSKNE